MTSRSNFRGPDAPPWDLYGACIHCGLCLNHCPTYRVLGLEMDSPRGRIRQVLEVDNGRIEIGPDFVTHIDRCLDCRACETACPSGVQYGRIVERARAQIEQHYPRGLFTRMTRGFFYGFLLKKVSRLKRFARLMWLYQASGLRWLVRRSGMLRVLGVEVLDELAPSVEGRFFGEELGKTFAAVGERRGRVMFHAGCIQQVAFAELNRATVRLLQKNGVEVVVPAEQQCCGALHAHAGRRDDARVLARKNIGAFGTGCDEIVTNAAGCGSTLKEYDDLLGGDSAREFGHRVRDVSEYLAGVGLREPSALLKKRIVYQDACHLLHGQKIKSQPRVLLNKIGAEIVEIDHADQCCGSAGTYNISQTELSMEVLERKMRDILAADPEMVVTANVGCQLQLQYGMRKAGRNVPVLHIVEALESCYR